jgi:hypothetical protein
MEMPGWGRTMKRISKFPWSLVVLAAVWPLAVQASDPTGISQPAGLAGQQNLLSTQAILFDSVDENLNPVSMADMIDGRPLVLAVGSCT